MSVQLIFRWLYIMVLLFHEQLKATTSSERSNFGSSVRSFLAGVEHHLWTANSWTSSRPVGRHVASMELVHILNLFLFFKGWRISQAVEDSTSRESWLLSQCQEIWSGERCWKSWKVSKRCQYKKLIIEHVKAKDCAESTVITYCTISWGKSYCRNI